MVGYSSFAQTTCANATNITANGTYTTPTYTGTYLTVCLASKTNIKAVWYKYTPAVNGEITVSSDLAANNGTTYNDDTRVSILKGTCGATTLTCVDYNDDVSDTNYLSTVTVPVAAGTTYYIQWDNYWNVGTPNATKANQFTFQFVAADCIRPGAADFYRPDTYTTTGANLYWNQAIGSPANYDTDWSIVLGDAAGTGTIVSSEAGTETYATVSLAGLPEQSNFRYFVRSNCGTSQSAWQGPFYGYLARTLPFDHTFEDADANYTDGFIGFSRLTTSSTSTPASYADGGDGTAMYTPNSTSADSDRWGYSRALSLVAGEVVTVNFKTRMYPDTADAMTLDVTVGSEQISSGQTEVIGSFTADDSSAYVSNSATWTAPADGVYYFGFHNNSPTGTVQSYMFIDTIEFSSVLGVRTILESDISTYPNPAKNVINISNGLNAVIESVELTDLNGRVVKTQTINATEGQVSINELSAGVYMMKVSTDKGVATKKVVKQ